MKYKSARIAGKALAKAYYNLVCLKPPVVKKPKKKKAKESLAHFIGGDLLVRYLKY